MSLNAVKFIANIFRLREMSASGTSIELASNGIRFNKIVEDPKRVWQVRDALMCGAFSAFFANLTL